MHKLITFLSVVLGGGAVYNVSQPIEQFSPLLVILGSCGIGYLVIQLLRGKLRMFS